MLRMITTRHLSMIAAGAFVLMAFAVHAQQPSPGGGGQAQAPAPKILVAGENPAITQRDKEGGPALTSVNIWRVHFTEILAAIAAVGRRRLRAMHAISAYRGAAIRPLRVNAWLEYATSLHHVSRFGLSIVFAPALCTRRRDRATVLTLR